MHRGRYMLAVLIATLVVAWPAQAATRLVNDPARPFTGRQLASMQHWLDESAEPTPRVLNVERGECPNAVACANVGYDSTGWFTQTGSMVIDGGSALHDRFAFIHEVGHVMDAETYTPAKRARIERLLGMVGDWMPDARYDPGTTPPFERAADAYAMCSIHPHWPGTWWHYLIRNKHGKVIGGGGSPTPYDFRAGRDRYERICSAIRLP